MNETKEESVSESPTHVDRRIGVTTLGRYLVADRQAILALASNRSTLWVGLLFVFSAAFAREYDGEDLLAEPWHLVIPLVASAGSSLILFTLVWTAARRHQMKEGTFGSQYLSFLGLYWMTAPLAWVYAIPVERFLNAPDSVRANLALLGLVALWRVVLMIRAISALYGASGHAAGFLVLTFGDALVFVLMQTVDVPLLQIMGGVRLSESERILAGTAEFLIIWSVLLAPIWLIGTATVLIRRRDVWKSAAEPATTTGATRALKIMAAVSLIVWIPILPFTQRPLQLRTRVDRLIENKQFEEAVTVMSAAGREAFGPDWSPPPHPDWRGTDIDQLVGLNAALLEVDAADWLHGAYRGKLKTAVEENRLNEWWDRADSSDQRVVVELLDAPP